MGFPFEACGNRLDLQPPLPLQMSQDARQSLGLGQRSLKGLVIAEGGVGVGCQESNSCRTGVQKADSGPSSLLENPVTLGGGGFYKYP